MRATELRLGRKYFNLVQERAVQGFGPQYDSDDPIVVGRDWKASATVCQALGLAWVSDGTVIGRESVLPLAQKTSKLAGKYVLIGWTSEIALTFSEERRRILTTTRARMIDELRLAYKTIELYPDFRSWPADDDYPRDPTEICLRHRTGGLRLGGVFCGNRLIGPRA